MRFIERSLIALATRKAKNASFKTCSSKTSNSMKTVIHSERAATETHSSLWKALKSSARVVKQDYVQGLQMDVTRPGARKRRQSRLEDEVVCDLLCVASYLVQSCASGFDL